jgi:geranyl-CoA carboxylase alpha subunit
VKSLNRLLIANRGEIAVRIARSARKLGIFTIGVCSDADVDSPHLLACDTRVMLGGAAPQESYLRGDKLLAAALATQADAIHPGYGFLSENADFAAAVGSANLIFVGPPAESIRSMGDKARARRRMSTAGVPVVPGYDGDSQEEAVLLEEAARIGFPVMIKAAAGGGGRGMRLVTRAEDFTQALRAAASEAVKAFGDGRLILERAVLEPRHVEFQVFADNHGHVIHLGERDCSIQRRHQKIVEESPSPALDATLRERMGQAAIAVTREINYVGAGTVEFLLDRDRNFFFMEMNTRLQVEHPVTELVTGLDLVELQLRVARGEPLHITQGDVTLEGHAIEVRLCAEEPADDFLPRTGSVVDWSPDELVRCDHAVAVGMTVTPWYDSMLAKVIARGTTRIEAVNRLAGALDRFTVLGVTTNRAFLARVLRSPRFREGMEVSTAFVNQEFPTARSRASVPDERTWALAAWLSVSGTPEALSIPSPWRNWNNSQPWPSRWRLKWRAPAELAGDGETDRSGVVYCGFKQTIVQYADNRYAVQSPTSGPKQHSSAIIDGVPFAYRFAWQQSVLWLHTDLGDFAFECHRRSATSASGSRHPPLSNEVRAFINGRVIELAVAAGASVSQGQRLIVLEAMKMEHEIRSSRAGTVATTNVRVGDQVAPGQWLIRFQEGS